MAGQQVIGFGPLEGQEFCQMQSIRFCTSHDGVRIAYATGGCGLSDWDVDDSSLEAWAMKQGLVKT
jgi:hypothetical protein